MYEKPIISVIVPVYKVEAYLDKCISTIVDQTYTNLEINFVVNRSPDNCPAICDTCDAKESEKLVDYEVACRQATGTTQHKEFVGIFRHCQNNIYAECMVGDTSYVDIYTMESE